MLHGFDVSQFNTHTKTIPWHTAQFACVRLTSGIDLDDLADEHLRRASYGGVVLLLGYAYLKGNVSGAAQARCLLDRAGSLEDAEHFGPLALGVDIEDPLKGPPWDRKKYADALFDFAVEIGEHAPARSPALYVSPAFWAQIAPHLGPERMRVIAAMRLWLADWTPPANVPAPWDRWTIWQNEVKDVSPGVPLDRDVFDGLPSDWRRAFHPDPHEELGPLVTTIQQASGHGPGGVEAFEDFPERPAILP